MQFFVVKDNIVRKQERINVYMDSTMQQEFQGTGEYVASEELMASVNIAIAFV